MQGHSENYFGDYRDFWWNQDFLDLIADRLYLRQHHSMLDVGCGQCHWSKLLVEYLGRPAKVVGIDNDIKWSEEDPDTREYFEDMGAEFELVKGDAQRLPFKDNSFDLVTCQTLLIHVKHPMKAIQEMKRVLKPGGTILCVEPNNVVQSLVKSSYTADNPIDEVLDHVKYSLIIERGKKKLGQGDNSLGDLLPGLFAEAGFKNIDACLSDKAIPMFPPYNSQEQMATMQQWEEGSSWKHSDYDDYTYFAAFGQEYMDFYDYYQKKYKHSGKGLIDAIDSEKYHSGGGAIMYLVSGIK
jgi:ubiquinone/menaquinone biosynthesis C-methylase UbiE